MATKKCTELTSQKLRQRRAGVGGAKAGVRAAGGQEMAFQPGNVPWARLPFVKRPARGPAKSSDWNVPATGGYFGGYQTGEALAKIFLKSLRDEEMPSYPLTNVVTALMAKFSEEGGGADSRSPGYASFRGQYIGFMNTISDLLVSTTKLMGGTLDRMSDQDLLKDANAGLVLDEAAYIAESLSVVYGGSSRGRMVSNARARPVRRELVCPAG